MTLYFLTILIIAIMLVVLAQEAGWIKPLPAALPPFFWVFMASALFLSLFVTQIA